MKLEPRKHSKEPQLFTFKLDRPNVKNRKGNVTGLNQKKEQESN